MIDDEFIDTAAHGQIKKVMTPWGKYETGRVFNIRDVSTKGYVTYVGIHRPTGKPGVRYSVFRMREKPVDKHRTQ
jgi:hypothetical protein